MLVQVIANGLVFDGSGSPDFHVAVLEKDEAREIVPGSADGSSLA
tara:strand:- start:306 stop:440 length:135 start_codon:yes stop_codon:yes gene_type:complete